MVRGLSLETPMSIAKLRFNTLAIHASQQFLIPTTGAIMTPVYLTSTYVQAGPGEHKGYEYSRTKNPTRKGPRGLPRGPRGCGPRRSASRAACSATACVMHTLDAGDHVICSDDVYGGTFRLFDKVFKRQGLDLHASST